MNSLIVRNQNDTDAAFERLSAASAVGCDTETTGLTPESGKLLSVQFSDGEINVFVPSSEGVRLGKLGLLLADKTTIKIFHNARFDLAFLEGSGYKTHNIYDTMLAEKVLTRGADQSASLAETLYRYFAIDLDKSQRKSFGRNWNRKWTPELVEYAMNDVIHLTALMNEQVDWMEKLGLREDYERSLKKMIFSRRKTQ